MGRCMTTDDAPLFVEFLDGPLDGDVQRSPQADAVPAAITHTTRYGNTAIYQPVNAYHDGPHNRRVVVFRYNALMTPDELREVNG